MENPNTWGELELAINRALNEHDYAQAMGYVGASRAMTVSKAIASIIEKREAVAWALGYTAGHSNAMRRMSDEPDAPTSPNPFIRKDSE